MGCLQIDTSPHESETLDPFHSDNTLFHATTLSLPWVVIISTPCTLDGRSALVSELNSQLLSSRSVRVLPLPNKSRQAF